MRILVLGAYGFIGSAIARELARRGHQVTGLGRNTDYGRRLLPQVEWITADLSAMTRAQDWRAIVERVDAVINASGLLQTGDGGSVEAVQFGAVRALVEASEKAGVKRLVQISAAGADPKAQSDFMETKARADALVQGSTVPSLVVRPGLVIGRDSYGGTDVIRTAAAAPIAFKLPFRRQIQCTALSDLVEAVARALEPGSAKCGCFDLVEQQSRSLDAIIEFHRDWLGLPKPRWSAPIPTWLLRTTSRTADLLGYFGWRSPLRRNGLIALEVGVAGDPEQSVALLGREALSMEEALSSQPSGKQDRLYARLTLVQPLLLIALAIMWAGSGAATLLQIDRAAAILDPSGINEATARAVAIGGGWIDIVLAGALLWRRTARAGLVAMIGLTVLIYLIGGTLLLPGLWADPLAPFAKALPATLLALIAYWTLERR